MDYRLALDLGTNSIGWAVFRIRETQDENGIKRWQPCAVIRAGVRIFHDGRDSKSKESLAVNRRDKRAQRRRRDRLLKRKNEMLQQLIDCGFFPQGEAARQALCTLNPYALRTKGLDEPLTPEEFGRVLFHINQRRGFKSNRKMDKVNEEKSIKDGGVKISVMKKAIADMREKLSTQEARTVGEFLYKRQQQGKTVRARKGAENYDLYFDRAMIEDEFEQLWKKQHEFNPTLYSDENKDILKDILLFQRPLKPIEPGRCTLKPSEYRAPSALPSVQQFRIYQELNHLRYMDEYTYKFIPLTLEQRDKLVPLFEKKAKVDFNKIKEELNWPSTIDLRKEDKSDDDSNFLLGNKTSNVLSKKDCFDERWFDLSLEQQDQIVEQILALAEKDEIIYGIRQILDKEKLFGEKDTRPSYKQRNQIVEKFLISIEKEEIGHEIIHQTLSETELIGEKWLLLPQEKQNEAIKGIIGLTQKNKIKFIKDLVETHNISQENAENISDADLPSGYKSLSKAAIDLILPCLKKEVIPYSEAVKKAGFNTHSQLESIKSHEFLDLLPYYGKYLQRHVSFGTNNPTDDGEKCYGKINNPTVHIALNQIRKVVNALIKEYGLPTQVVIEVARELSQGKKQRDEYKKRINDNRKTNERIRKDVAEILSTTPDNVTRANIEKMILWEELSDNPLERCCPYTGKVISLAELFSDKVEVDHILPRSKTLDDSLNNKVVCMTWANRFKGNRSPFEAFGKNPEGYDYTDIVARAKKMKGKKLFRFMEDAFEKWERGFAARALNDTRYIASISREYLSLICKDSQNNCWVIPGLLTAWLRQHYGLNKILSPDGKKNRNDHRHHAVDACVIGIIDKSLLQKFSTANRKSQKIDMDQMLKSVGKPWNTYKAHIERAISQIWVSYKPNHGYQSEMMKESACRVVEIEDNKKYGHGISHKRDKDGRRIEKRELKRLILIYDSKKQSRHGYYPDGSPKPSKGHVLDSNYSIEIYKKENGQWGHEVISTYQAYQIVKEENGLAKLRDSKYTQSGKPLLMRLIKNDLVRFEDDTDNNSLKIFVVRSIRKNGKIEFLEHFKANIAQSFTKSPNKLSKLHARQVTVSPHGRLKDPGFRE